MGGGCFPLAGEGLGGGQRNQMSNTNHISKPLKNRCVRTHRTSGKETMLFSRFLRKNMTYCEKLLWERLRNKSILGVKFRRQHPIGPYIADFFCREASLVIEVDGDIHLNAEQKRKDDIRDLALTDYGLTVLRFCNKDIVDNIDNVIATIEGLIVDCLGIASPSDSN